MQHRWFGMRLWMLALCATSLTVACGDNSVERVSRSGRLQFALRGTAASGIEYRLRHGTFAITGASTGSASTEDDLQAETISVELSPGDYSILLNSGWQLEAATPNGDFASVEATLTSANPQSFTIVEKKTTSVIFRFRVGDDTIVLGTGSVSISIEVDESTTGTGGAAGAAMGGSGGNATTLCTAGDCHVIACTAGYADCDGIPTNGCEVNLETDANHCGACEHVCGIPAELYVCAEGICQQCYVPRINCDGVAANGCETDIGRDRNNCGLCGFVCPSGEECDGEGFCARPCSPPRTGLEPCGCAGRTCGSGMCCWYAGKVVTTKCMVAQATVVACQVVDDIAKTLPTALVAWASLGKAKACCVEVLQHSVTPTASSRASTMAAGFGALVLAFRLAPALVLLRANHGGSATVRLDDQDLTIINGSRSRLETWSCLRPKRINHAQHRPLAWHPLVGLLEDASCCRERHHGAQLSDRHHGAQAEPRTEAQFAIDG